MSNSKIDAILKLSRFVRLYGLQRAIFKAAGRARISFPLVWRKSLDSDISLIGCGQFGFSTLGFFLCKRFGRRLRWCYDPEKGKAISLKNILGVKGCASSAEEGILDPATKYVYIASNHASHTDYAIQALEAGKTVYVEKPVAVSFSQLNSLAFAVEKSNVKAYAGYNRPFSKFVRKLKSQLSRPVGGLSLSCFVSGHVIESEHWYRDPNEGTRICGNAGHWIDLFIHMLAWRGELPDSCSIQMLSADFSEIDDNFVLSIATDRSDIFSLMLTARSEPFEGINETINFQWNETIAKINDFRRMTVWQNSCRKHFRSWPKDVGHQSASLQPFSGRERDWNEILVSSLMMLHVAEMVRNGEHALEISLRKELEMLRNGEYM